MPALRCDHELIAVTAALNTFSERALAGPVPALNPEGVTVSCVEKIHTGGAIGIVKLMEVIVPKCRSKRDCATAEAGHPQV